MVSLYAQRDKARRAARDADQAEVTAIRYGSANAESGTTDEEIAGSLRDEFPAVVPASQQEEWADDDAAIEQATSAIVEELRRRSVLLESAYPFSLNGATLRYCQSRSLLYEFLLATTVQRDLKSGDFGRIPIAFERLSRDILASYFRMEAYRSGWPRDEYEERPTRLRELVERLAELTRGEFAWSPDPDAPADPPSNRGPKDAGMDFVLWQTAPDDRPGAFIAIGQCACGDDFVGKYRDLTVEGLREWMRPGFATPLRLFTVPHHIADDMTLKEASAKAGLTFDRVRLLRIAESNQGFASDLRNNACDKLEELIKLVWGDFEVAVT
jgi:hypothetical protein